MRRYVYSRTAALAGALIAVLVCFEGGVPAGAAAPPASTFNANLLLPGSGGVAEPSIRTDRLGQSFVTGPTGIGGGCPAWRVNHGGSAAAFIGRPDHSAGGGDCDWAIGPQETAVASTDSVLAFSSLTLPNITVAKSDDGGTTFGPPNPLSAQVAGDDRMWQAADPRLNTAGFADIFMTYHDVSIGNIELSVSVDGGQTYTQNSPLINYTQVPAAQVLGALSGNELGNIVARRDATGKLTLYSIFQTPDSSDDNVAQGQAGTQNFNRVWEAVGTVSDATGVTPVVTWNDYEIYHGPLGARYNRIFPVTAVDGAGKVYAFWTDGNSVFVKSDATGTGWTPTAAPLAIANPTGVNTTVMPWVQAGAAGIVDVVFYGAHGGAGAQPNPQDDVNNVWDTYFAQTIDGGATWTVSQASDHDIHKGPICIDGLNCDLSSPARDRTLLDFFQVSIDPTNGAADIAYADDHASPGNSVVYFTRQCAGISATTGALLANDCVVPPPPPALPQGSTCPGPQVADFSGDAPNNYPAGDGANMDNLDIVSASFGTPDASTIAAQLTIKNLSAPPPPANLVSALWTVYWQFGGVTYFAQATSNGAGDKALFSYFDGTFANGNFSGNNPISGTAVLGPNGTLTMIVPRADVGNPANGATLSNPTADTHGSFTVQGNGPYYTAAADLAPNSGFGSPYVVGQTCSKIKGHKGKGSGHVTGKSGAPAAFTLDADQTIDGQPNSVTITDTSNRFISVNVTSVTFNDALHQVILIGTGTDNGKPVTFTAQGIDGGQTALDKFTITLSDGYVAGGVLLDGAVTLS